MPATATTIKSSMSLSILFCRLRRGLCALAACAARFLYLRTHFFKTFAIFASLILMYVAVAFICP